MANADTIVAPRTRPLVQWPTDALADLGQCERNLWSAAGLVAALILGFEAIAWIESYFVGDASGARLVENAAETSTRFFTIPHVIIGFLFMATSTRNQTSRKRAWIIGLLLVGVVLCLAYSELLSSGGKMLGAAFLYSYFLVHELRDELNFYRTLDAAKRPEDDRAFRRFGREQIALLVTGVVFILWVVGTMRTPAILTPPGLSVMGQMGIIALFGIGWFAAMAASYRRFAARRGTSVRQTAHDHRQLVRLYAAVFLLTLLGAVATDRLYPIILLHVAVWYVVTCRMLKQRPPATERIGTWAWMRGTLPGFQFLHIGLAAACLMLGAFCVYTSGPLEHIWWLISPEAFPFWTIIHISVSFVPR